MWERTSESLSIQTVYSHYKSKQLNLRPTYQRGLVWNKPMKQYLIWCLLRGRDISHFYFHAQTKGKKFWYDVVDGQQRLNAIISFLEGEFSLSPEPNRKHRTDSLADGLVEGINVTRKTFSQLPEPLQTRILTYTIHATVIKTDDAQSIIEQFVDLQAAKTLSPQQIREAYPSALNTKIRELETHPLIKKIRYTHQSEVAARLLLSRIFLWEHDRRLSIANTTRLTALYLESRFEILSHEEVDQLAATITANLDCINTILGDIETPLYNNGALMMYWFIRSLVTIDPKTKKKVREFYQRYAPLLVIRVGWRIFERQNYLDAVYNDILAAYNSGDYSQPNLNKLIRKA